MLKYIFILIFLTSSQVGCAQRKQPGQDILLFEKALLLQEMVDRELELDQAISDSIKLRSTYASEIKESILEKALELYSELIDGFPDSKLLFRALNNKGFVEMSLGDTAAARSTFLAILNSGADDKEKGGVGSGIMGEPYANYKNRAAKVLASISMEEKQLNEALTYLDATKKYPYRHFCGNEYAADRIYMAQKYAQCYLGLGDYQRAFQVLLPNILENGLASNSSLVDTAYAALIKEYDKARLKQQFEAAFQDLKTEKVGKGKNAYEQQYIVFLGTKIEVDSWSFGDIAANQGKLTENLYKNSRFYRQLSD